MKMSITDDESDRNNCLPSQSNVSKAEQRKSNKPIMEKRRRARINHCLNELKALILEAMKKDPARHSKLEKADILEMTVKHLQTIQRQQLTTAVSTDPAVLMRFKTGFDECASEVNRYIARIDGVDSGVKQRLISHLNRCVNSLNQISPSNQFINQPNSLFSSLTQNLDKGPGSGMFPGDVNNNGQRVQVGSGLQLIPSQLPTGEIALLLPNSRNVTTNTFINNCSGINHAQIKITNKNYQSAFTAVGLTTKPEPMQFGQFYPTDNEHDRIAKVKPFTDTSFRRKEGNESSYKTFHVEIPNSCLTAQVSVPHSIKTECCDVESRTICPVGLPQVDVVSERSQRTRNSVLTTTARLPEKRPADITNINEPVTKLPKYSVNVTLCEGVERFRTQSVIVGDPSVRSSTSSTSNSHQNTNRDMWRPW